MDFEGFEGRTEGLGGRTDDDRDHSVSQTLPLASGKLTRAPVVAAAGGAPGPPLSLLSVCLTV